MQESSALNFFESGEVSGFVHHYLQNSLEYYGLKDGLIDIPSVYKEKLSLLENKAVFYNYDYFNGDVLNTFSDKKYLNPGEINKKKNHIFDLNVEGWSSKQTPVAKDLHKSLKGRIQLNKIFYITGNLAEKLVYEHWVKTIDDEEKINIVEICAWDSFGYDTYVRKHRHRVNQPDYYIERKNDIDKTYIDNKFYINLNRRSRKWRSYFVYKLFEHKTQDFGIISHSRPDDVDTIDGLNDDEAASFNNFLVNNLPLIADTKDFETNWANYLNNEIHSNALFSVVGETLQENYDNTSLFYSEKSFRPMILGQPMLIWGQRHCNKKLSTKLGYKLYNNWFDYSFDSIKDEKERANALVLEIKRVCEKLKLMSRSEQINWAYKDEETLLYNRNRLRYNEFSINNFFEFIEKMAINEKIQ